MLDIVKMMPVVDIYDLMDVMEEIEGLSRDDVFNEFLNMHYYDGGSDYYMNISDDWVADWENISDKLRHKLLEMMTNEDLPKEFIIHLY